MNVTPQSDWNDYAKRVAQTRDKAAFTALFDHFAPRIKAYLLRLNCDAATAEEIAQETLATLWNKAALFDPEKAQIGTWLYRIARNRRIDATRRDRVDYLDPMDSAFVNMAGEALPERSMDDVQQEDAVRRAMSGLPQEQLALVKAAFYDGLSHSQIAESTGLPLGTVKSRIRLAFSRLRRALEQGGVTGVDESRP